MVKDFLWGASFSGPQTEGIGRDKSLSILDYWFMEQPQIFNKQTYVRNNFLQAYEADIKLAKELNFNSLRTSIQWTFLIPDGKNINPLSVAFYNDMINKMINNGIKPIINLFHFDMPLWAMDKGGWNNPEVIDDYLFFAEKCFNLFGDRVKQWITFNEPMLFIRNQYINKLIYPAIDDYKIALNSMINITLAHKLVVKKFHSNNNHQGKIGVVVRLEILQPTNKKSPQDCQIADLYNVFNYQFFTDAIIKGQLNFNFEQLLVQAKIKIDLDNLKNQLRNINAIDFLGISYFNHKFVNSEKIKTNYKDQLFHDLIINYLTNDQKFLSNDFDAQGIYDALMLIKNNYPNMATYVAAIGISAINENKNLDNNKIIQDQYRINYIEEHLLKIKAAIKDSANCFGVHLWSYIDSWNWTASYKKTFGIIHLDTNSEVRTFKKSFFWIKQLTLSDYF